MKNTLLALLLLLLPISTAARSTLHKQFVFQQIPIQNGLSYSVQCTTVGTVRGYAWIGTKTGIGRFDGYELKRYLNFSITALVVDSLQNVWASTEKGLYRYNYAKDEFSPIFDKAQQPINASAICLWDDGVIFSGNGILYKFDYATKRIDLYRSLHTSMSAESFTHLYRWDKQTLWCVNRWNQSVLYDIVSAETKELPFDTQNLMATLIDSKGRIWVAPYNQGVKCYDRNGKLLYSYQTNNSPLRSDIVLALTECNGRIWIGTDGEGIHILNPDSGHIKILAHIPGDPHSLPNNSILSLQTDANGSVWAGSLRGGVVNIKEVGIKLYGDALPGLTYGLSEKSVISLYQEPDEERIWIGTDGGGINSFDPQTQKFHHVRPSWRDKVASITGVDNRRLLVSIFSKGIFFFDKQLERYEPLIVVNDSINKQLCQQGKTVNLMRNSDETVLLLSSTPYSYHLHKRTFTPIKLATPNDNIKGVLLPIGRIGKTAYLHDQKHIYALHDNEDRFQLLHKCQGDTLLTCIAIDENGMMWTGSNYGLGRFSRATGMHEVISDGIIGKINSLLCDLRGRVWAGTNDKLFAYLIDQDEIILYSEPDGAMPNEYLEKPRLLSNEGDLYLGSVNGLLRINKELPEEPTTPPILEFSDILVGGERMNGLITGNHTLKLPERNAPIQIKIRATNREIFRHPMYRYTLKGMGGQKMYSFIPEITLNNVSAGTYQILAACSTRHGGWTEEYPILTLTILPKWYKTGWFVLGCCIFFAAAITLSFIALLQRKENKLKWKLKEHEQSVYEEKVRFLINIHHELRTPLTLIHAPLKELLKKLSPQSEIYHTIESISRQSGRMKKLLNMVLDVRKMEVGQSTLNLETVELTPWIEEMIDDFRLEADMKHIQISYRNESGVSSLCFDKEKCTTVLSNLLINALKYSSDNQHIEIRVSLSDDLKHVRVSISDEGPGLKDIDTNSLFTRFYQGNNSRPGTGIGLSYAKILTEQHGGSIGVYENCSIPGNHAAIGSTFWFELPINVKPGKVTLQPQPYLNELLASTEEIESLPDETMYYEETQKCTLLIVDDNRDLTDYLASALKEYFSKVWVAQDGAEALQCCKTHHPQVVVSDIQMPLMNGYELCKQIKEDLEISHTPVILLTARNDEQSRIFGYKNGADAYLTKPFEVGTLYTAIYSLLKNRARIKAAYTDAGNLPTPQEGTFSLVDETFLKQINEIIEQNLDNSQLGIPYLCNKLSASRSSLYNKLKALTGMGANEYITKVRIERAAYMLRNTSMNVTEIADKVGFSTQRYFSTVFKQTMGCSPSQYKENPPAEN